MIAVSIIYIILLCLLLATSHNQKFRRHHIAAKTLTSVGFVTIACAGLVFSERNIYASHAAYFLSLLPGLIFCMAGDIFLAIRSLTKKIEWFAWGIAMFATAHVLFIVFLGKYNSYGFWSYIIPLASVIVAYILFALPSIDAKGAKWVCLVYSYVVALFVVRAYCNMIALDFSTQGVFLAIGATLFYMSDAMLIFLYFSKKEFKWLHAANLIAYYLGMGLIASSVYFAF